jgi:hypothetical protein
MICDTDDTDRKSVGLGGVDNEFTGILDCREVMFVIAARGSIQVLWSWFHRFF